jgi:hypothetical protein
VCLTRLRKELSKNIVLMDDSAGIRPSQPWESNMALTKTTVDGFSESKFWKMFVKDII